ncbi:TrbI/VirB10 family protein [Sphingomonas gilva]|uniref:TrbI/VirB10 family protein n=1 Tax=Sphingomonas gilva TaxID=2305907 RepID=A0A396RNS3_9SPHN|nr:TrbI/VirB10 family protein [Sphingomonas gilva]RHW18167.1 TrbI/VirB10 family protein [Sphingomonas gilva]
MTGAAKPATDEQAPRAPKLDPESFALRAPPARAIRFRRGAVVAIAAIASVSIIATTWFALTPAARQIAGQAADSSVTVKAPADTLSALPASYGDVPKLGPPLPGDLGRPILEHQRAMATETASGYAGRAEQAAIAEREQLVAELKVARESGLLVQSGSGAPPWVEPADAVAAGATVASAPAPLAIDPNRDANARQRKADFVGAQANGGDVNPQVLRPASSPYMLSAGSVIAASLITGLRSDIPGLVTAQVTERVFDSATGRIELIPQGARLIGSYDSVVAFGQRRALVVWQRIIMPDGSSLTLDNVPATDPSGYAGLADKVDFHTWTLLKGVALSTLLGVGSNLTFSGESDLVQAIRESTQQNASQAGDQLTSRNLQIQPTITIRPGAPVRLVIHRDLILAPWKG